MIGTIEQLVEAVGGHTQAAKIANVSLSAVSNWKARGSIPTDHYFAFADALGPRAGDLDRTIFRPAEPWIGPLSSSTTKKPMGSPK